MLLVEKGDERSQLSLATLGTWRTQPVTHGAQGSNVRAAHGIT